MSRIMQSSSDKGLEAWGVSQFVKDATDEGYYYEFPMLDSNSGPLIQVQGKKLINFSSIDFLGFQTEQWVREAFISSIEEVGLVTGGSRATQGVNRSHSDLEVLISEVTGKQRTSTFASGLLANLGFLQAMTTRFEVNSSIYVDNSDVVVIMDHDAHWSLWKGAQHLKFGERLFSFKHNDVKDLWRCLERNKGKKTLVVVETIYSSDGSMAPLGEILDLCENFEAISYVDNANGFMIYGDQSRPYYNEYCHLPRATFEMLSLSKSIGLEGGAISGPKSGIILVEVASGTSVFTASIQPPTAATATRIISYLKENPAVIDQYLERISTLREQLSKQGFSLLPGNSYIISIMLGRDTVAERVREDLLTMGFQVPIFRYPAVKRNAAVMRLMVNRLHSERHISEFLSAMEKIKRRYSL